MGSAPAITFHVLGQLRTYCAGAAELAISAHTVRAALEDIERTGGRIRGIVLWNAPDPILSELRPVETRPATEVPATV
jgi:hypothetical protein